MKKMNVKTGDTVMIISGRDKGKTGKILEVSPKEDKVIVEGCNLVSKHVKPRQAGQAGGIIEAESAIYASKVMILDPKTKKPVRVRFEKSKDGKRVRITTGKSASGSEI